jgi:phosphotransferase system HPr-like phosphotransfer protein
MLRRIQVTIGFAVFLFDAVTFAFFADYFSKTDWLFGHHQGPVSSAIAARVLASAGIIGTAIWMAIAMVRWFRSPAEKPATRSGGLALQGVVLALLLPPTGFMAAPLVINSAQVRKGLQVQRIKAGDASVAELIAGLRSSDHGTRFSAVQQLENMGPRATSAIPALADVVQDPAQTPNLTISPSAAKALAAMGPDAAPAIPALVQAIKNEGRHNLAEPSVLSNQAGRALTKIGPASIPELTALLAHKGRTVRMTAAGALGNMGPQAKDAVPALTEALNDEYELMRQWARVALDRIENRRPVSPF